MNLFILDNDPVLAAKYHCNKHIVKMPTETAQMLSTAYHILQPDIANKMQNIYKSTHSKHPCTVWIMQSKQNYDWAVQLGIVLSAEYEKRYNKRIKSLDVIEQLKEYPGNNADGLTPFALAMPDQYKCENAVEAYRNYYLGEKKAFASWDGREIPDWWKQ